MEVRSVYASLCELNFNKETNFHSEKWVSMGAAENKYTSPNSW